jgi:hypothetical protein
MIHNVPTMRHLGLTLLVCIPNMVVLCAGSPASAQDSVSKDSKPTTTESVAWAESDSPEVLMARGIEFRKRREDRLALAAFERSWTLGGAPRALAQLALAEQALGFWREAHAHLEQALNRDEDPWISEHQPALRVALNEIASHLGTVEINCNVDGAEVRVDGRIVGHTPLQQPLRLVAGKSVVEVGVDGYFDMARQVQVDAGGIARVSFNLTQMTPPQALASTSPPPVSRAPLASSVPATSDPAAPFAPMPMPAPASVSRDQSNSGRDLLTYTSTGLAALGAAVGVTGYVIREVNVRLYNDDTRCAQLIGPPRSVECGAEFAAWQRGELLAIAGSSAAGVFGLTALYLWWSRPDTETEGGLACAVGATSITCGSDF